MQVFMIGGTGLLGSMAASKLIENGHAVISLALPPIPENAPIPKEMTLVLRNYSTMSDDEIREYMKGCDSFVFAAGVDERIEGKPPIYEMYRKFNIEPLRRLIPLAKEVGIKKVVILGSYFSFFDREWKDLDLYKHHPYIRSRIDQANLALSFMDEQTKIAILELPYIFGVQPGRKPVWVFLVEQIRRMKWATFYPKGGTAMITAKQVGEVIATVATDGHQGNMPIAYVNMTWKEMLKIFHQEMGIRRPIISIPKWLYRWVLKRVKKDYERRGIESGLDFSGLADIMSRNAYVDSAFVSRELGVGDDDIVAAIRQSVRLSVGILDGESKAVDMVAE